MLAVVMAAALALWTVRRTRVLLRRWFDRAVVRAVRQFRARIDRYKLVAKRNVRAELLQDPAVLAAIRTHAAAHGITEAEARVAVARYLHEIVPHFNVLSYYRVGYTIARLLLGLLYRVEARAADRRALQRIPRRDIVVYLMNHRSNADYVVVAYVLAGAVSISYAVGEWARVWPLEYVFKSFGAYFVRRGFRDPLYHTVLRRYVQLITRHGVTQGIFLEGGLSRDGAPRPAKIGLLDAAVTTLLDLPPDRDIRLVPVALNYDRVLEDRSLIRETSQATARPGRLRQMAEVAHYVLWNVLRLLSGNLRKYGRAAVVFGPPASVRAWVAEHPGVLERPKQERMAEVQRLADGVMARITTLNPVTPVPLAAAALLSFGETVVPRRDLFDRLEEYLDHLRTRGAYVLPDGLDAEAAFDRAWRTLRMRRLVVRHGDALVILPGQRPLLEFYANSVRSLLPGLRPVPSMHPAREADASLPHLRPRS